MLDRSKVKKMKLTEQPSDFSYWINQTADVRLAALESIREEFNSWKFNDQQGFQRIYRVVKQKSRAHIKIQDSEVDFIDLESFKKNKKAVGRYQDLADLENLE